MGFDNLAISSMRRKTVPVDHVDVRGPEKPFQQENRARPAEFAQLRGFFEIEQTEAIGRTQAGERTGQAMAIGIGFDDGPDLRVRRVAASDSEVVG